MFEVDLDAGVTYYIYTVIGDSDGHIEDTALQLLDSDGTTVLATNDNSGGGISAHGSYVEFTPDAAIGDATILVLPATRVMRGSFQLYVSTAEPDLSTPPPPTTGSSDGPLVIDFVTLTPRPETSGDHKLCFDPRCPAPILDHSAHHTVVAEGCEADGSLGSICRITCMPGFEPTVETEGRCTIVPGMRAAYVGQGANCEPERALGENTMSESYCQLEATEVILDCCDLLSSEGGLQPSSPSCSTEMPPDTCVLGCAERWLPLLEDCDAHLGDFSALTLACEDIANNFLAWHPRPSSFQA
eukprot:SAG31_NODE_2285_length_6011_cov_5.276556_3_plen_300_part_00